MTKFANISAIIATAALGLAGVANAGDAVNTNNNGQRIMLVKYEDLAVDTPAGLETLDRRIAAAAEKVCGHNPGSRMLATNASERACIAKASVQARTAVIAKAEARGKTARIAAAQ